MSEKEIIEEIKSLSPSAEACESILNLYNEEVKISHYLQSELDQANAKLIEEKGKNKELAKDKKALVNNYDNVLRYFISKDVIKNEIKELENMKVDGEVFTTAVNFAKKEFQKLLEE